MSARVIETNWFERHKLCKLTTHTENGYRVFSLASEDRTRNNSSKLQQGKVRLGIRENFLNM